MINPCMSSALTADFGVTEIGVAAALLRIRFEGVAVGSSALTALGILRLKGMMGGLIVDARYGRDAGRHGCKSGVQNIRAVELHSSIRFTGATNVVQHLGDRREALFIPSLSSTRLWVLARDPVNHLINAPGPLNNHHPHWLVGNREIFSTQRFLVNTCA